MTRLPGALLLLVLSSAGAFPNDLERLVRQSDSLFKAGNLDSVIVFSQNILEDYPDDDKSGDSLKFKLLDNIGSAYRYLHQYDRAESTLTAALNFCREKFGEDSYQVGMIYGDLSSVYHENGNSGKAITLANLAKDVYDKVFGPDNIHSAHALHNTALLEMTVGRLSRAEPMFKKALEIYEKYYGEGSIKTAVCLRNLGALYTKMAMHSEAEDYFKKSLEIKIRSFGRDSPETATLFIDFAQLYHNLARHDEAESLLIKAIGIFETSPDEMQLYMAKAMITLASLYASQKKYREAEPLLEKALKIRENHLGSDHPDAAHVMDKLGQLYAARGLYDKAEPIILKSVDIQAKRWGLLHIYTAYAYKRLCDFYLLKGDLLRAEKAIDSSMACLDSLFGSDNFLMTGCFDSRRNLLLRQGKFARAIDDARKSVELRSEAFFGDVITLPETDALNYSIHIRQALSRFLSIYFENRELQNGLLNDAIDLILFNKGLISDGLFERQLAVLMHGDVATQALFDSLKTLKFEQSRLFFSAQNENHESARERKISIESAIREIENTLARNCANIDKWQRFKKLNGKTLLSLLPRDAVYIDYFKYDHYHQAEEIAEPHYLAIILSHELKPILIDLGKAQAIDKQIGRYRLHMLETAGHGGITTADDVKRYHEITSPLCAALWQPLADYIPHDCTRLLIIPDDALNRISFAGIRDAENKYLVEKYTVHYLSSGRDLLRINEPFERGYGLFAMGDPNYNNAGGDCDNQKSGAPPNSPARATERSLTRAKCGELKNIKLNRLPGTSREIDLITKIWRKATAEPADIYTDNRATEKCFKSNVSGKRVIHLATHGYFLDETCGVSGKASGNSENDGYPGVPPLLLSGLFFAGVNNHDRNTGGDECDDGILTANEVTAINLSGVDLVVLSACESGLGELQAGEGVFGLRRAFQMAGARTVISTLWPITDQSVSDILSPLYDTSDSTPAESLRRSQLAKINRLRENGQSDHPYIWDGYVIFGDWR